MDYAYEDNNPQVMNQSSALISNADVSMEVELVDLQASLSATPDYTMDIVHDTTSIGSKALGAIQSVVLFSGQQFSSAFAKGQEYEEIVKSGQDQDMDLDMSAPKGEGGNVDFHREGRSEIQVTKFTRRIKMGAACNFTLTDTEEDDTFVADMWFSKRKTKAENPAKSTVTLARLSKVGALMRRRAAERSNVRRVAKETIDLGQDRIAELPPAWDRLAAGPITKSQPSRTKTDLAFRNTTSGPSFDILASHFQSSLVLMDTKSESTSETNGSFGNSSSSLDLSLNDIDADMSTADGKPVESAGLQYLDLETYYGHLHSACIARADQ